MHAFAFSLQISVPKASNRGAESSIFPLGRTNDQC
jgi:hypothetical protein